ncbi:hypothetical protein RND81_13G153300 [Saponaria officinalis]|uniref:F-box domain-containing protein n=1 Tax=Saponaria officinalis TaxID=3572 RepID=A0AAW1H5T8_SAPOF
MVSICNSNRVSYMESRQNLDSLPLELEVEILSRLSLKQLLRLRCLSKWWNAEISSPSFSKLYQQRRKGLDAENDSDSDSVIMVSKESIFSLDLRSNKFVELPPPPRAARFVCSFNGMLLFVELKSNLWECVLYNPLIGAYTVLPQLIIDVVDHPGPNFLREEMPFIGFGYDSKSDDLKILSLIQYTSKGRYLTHLSHEAAYIYSMKTKSWKVVKPYTQGEYQYMSKHSKMVYCNDALHWISIHKNDQVYTIISALNLGTEKDYVLPNPDDQICYLVSNLAVLKGFLHLINNSRITEYDIWIMREYGVKRSWTLLYRCLLADLMAPHSLRACFNSQVPYAYSEDGQEILVGVSWCPVNFVCCNLQTRGIKKVKPTYLRLETHFNMRLDYPMVPWVPSLTHPCSL